MTGEADTITEDMVDACVSVIELAVKAGGQKFCLGYTGCGTWEASVTVGDATHYARDHVGPGHACLALLPFLLQGTHCQRCRRPITLTGDDGCHWHRSGASWSTSCS